MHKHLIVILSALLLAGCVPTLTRDDGNGGRIQEHFTLRDTVRIKNLADGYCQQRGLSVAQVSQVSAGCVLACGSEFDVYEFRCGNANFVSNQQNFVQECAEKGLKIDSKVHTQCVSKKEKAEQARIEKEQKTAAARAEKETREQAKREREYAAKMQQEKINADKAQCDAYGIKRGTNAFATCLMQIDQMKQQQQMQQQMLQAQEQQAALQRQAVQEQANAQQQRDKAAYYSCIGQPNMGGGFLYALGKCKQDPYYRAPADAPSVEAPPAPQIPRNTRCVAGHDGIVNCQTW